MTKITLVLALLVFIFLPACKSKTVVRKIDTKTDAPMKDLNGVTYRLPRTVINVTVPVKLVQVEPGPFVQFWPCFFPQTPSEDVVVAKNRKIQVLPPTFDSFGEPDPHQNYMVSIKGGILENKSLLMEFSPRGVLKKGEATSEDKSLEFALKTIQTATSIAGSAIAAKDSVGAVDEASTKRAVKCFEKLGNQKYMDWKALDDKASRDAAEDKQMKDLEREMLDEMGKAEEAFAKLTELIRRRDAMISSPSDPSADSFKLRLAETDKSIEAYRQLFLGISAESVWNAVFQIRPTDANSQYSKPLLAFVAEGSSKAEDGGENAGVCPNLGLVKEDGVQPPGKFKTHSCVSPNEKILNAIWLRIEKDTEDAGYLNKIRAVSQIYEQDKKKRGWYFRIAAKGNLFAEQASATIANLQTAGYTPMSPLELARTHTPIAQLGVVASIPASGSGRSQQSALELNGITGELVNFKFSSAAALEKERLGEIQGTAEELIKANDPLAKKKRELEKLKTEKEIRDINANLNPQQ